MEKSLQQRLVGAVLLVALGVIFVPMLLDGSGFKTRNMRNIEMPDAPGFPPLDEIELDPVVPTHRKQVQEVDKAKTDNIAEAKKQLQTPVQAFALQVSTVTVKENAYDLRDKLRKGGYAAFVEERSGKGKTSYSVRIGPELDMSRLEQMKQRIKQEYKLDGFILNHPS